VRMRNVDLILTYAKLQKTSHMYRVMALFRIGAATDICECPINLSERTGSRVYTNINWLHEVLENFSSKVTRCG
jgi:hypothetical protein